MAHMVRLQSSDDKCFDVEWDVVKQSGTIYIMITDLGLRDGGEGTVITVPLPNVDNDTLQNVLKWCEEHRSDEPHEEETGVFEDSIGKRTFVPEWDKQFLKELANEQLISIIQAANYMDIKLLLDYSCEIIADTMIGKEVAEIRELWRIENDLTPEEEENKE